MQHPAIGHDDAKSAVTFREMRSRMNSAAGAEDAGTVWIDSLRAEPLPEIVSAINKRESSLPSGQRGAFADCFERMAPERLDYWLYREFVYSSQRHGPRQVAQYDSGKRVDRIIEALSSPNPLVATGSRLVLTRLKYRHLNELAVAGSGALERLADTLDRSAPIRDGFDAALCDAVCIPYVKLMILEARTKQRWAEQESQSVGFHQSVAVLGQVVAEIALALQERLNRHNPQTLGSPLPLNPNNLHWVAQSVPWDYKETISCVSMTLVNVGSYIVSISHGVEEAGLDATLLLLDQSILLAQCGWLSLRRLSEAIQTENRETQRSSPEMEKDQIKALGHLAELQQLRGNHILAAQYAVFALHANLAFNQFKTECQRGSDDDTSPEELKGALTKSELSTMRTLANCMGLDAPGNWPRGGKRSTPAIFADMLRLQPEFDNIFATTLQVGHPWNGYDENVLKILIDGGSPEVICHALEAAIKTGNPRLVMKLTSKSPSDQRSDLQHHYNRRARILAAINSATVLQYADVLARVQQQAVSLCFEGATSRTTLRTLWKQVVPNQFSVMEMLFIHHAKVGFSYYGLDVHYAGEQATWALYKSAPQAIRNRLFSDFAGMVGASSFVPMSLADFRKGTLSVGVDEVLISLCTRKGHEASLIACGPSRSVHYVIDSGEAELLGNGTTAAPRDWHEIVDDFSWMATMYIRNRHAIQPEPAIVGLAIRLIDAVRAVNPNVKRVAFHGDPFFRAVPWQHVFQHWARVKDHRISSFTADRVRGLRTVADDGGRDFVVFHVEGIKFQTENRSAPPSPKVKSREPGWVKQNINPGDKICDPIVAALDNPHDVALGMQYSAGTRLSVVGHGLKGARTGQMADTLTPEAMNRDMAEYEMVAFHACYAAYTMNNLLADLGGLPGFLLSHGCQVLFASSLPLQLKEVLTLERYVSGLRNYDSETVMEAYLNAVREDRACAFYNLYLPQRTPCLVISGSSPNCTVT